MAARKKLSNTKPPSEAPGINAQQVDRLIRLIVLLVVKGESKGEKIHPSRELVSAMQKLQNYWD